MSTTKAAIKQRESTVSKDLKVQIADARSALNSALIRGDKTDALRSFLRELEQKQGEPDAAVSAQEAAQRARQQQDDQRITDLAQTLADARQNRINAITQRFSIPAR